MKTDYYKMTKEERNNVTANYFVCTPKHWDNHPSDLKVGDLAWFCGWSAASYKLFQIESVDNNIKLLESIGKLKNGKRYQVTYTIRNIKSNGELGNITREAFAYDYYRKKTKKYKVTTQHAKALLGCEPMINTDGKVFDITKSEGQSYVIIYPGKMDLFFRNIQNLRRLVGGLCNKFDWDKPLPSSKEVTGNEFIF